MEKIISESLSKNPETQIFLSQITRIDGGYWSAKCAEGFNRPSFHLLTLSADLTEGSWKISVLSGGAKDSPYLADSRSFTNEQVVEQLGCVRDKLRGLTSSEGKYTFFLGVDAPNEGSLSLETVMKRLRDGEGFNAPSPDKPGFDPEISNPDANLLPRG
ncbi:MAG: hypothetical protein WC521_06490 [Bdellovibrionales bacterium]